MSDLVERLNSWVSANAPRHLIPCSLLAEAADEIKALRAQVKEYAAEYMSRPTEKS